MTDDAATLEMRRWREYLRRYEQARRAADRENDMPDNYATVRRYIEAIYKLAQSLKLSATRRPISDTEVITWALKMAADTLGERRAGEAVGAARDSRGYACDA